MPRFFFDLVDGDPVSDTEGSECADIAAAREEAKAAAREIMANRIKAGSSAEQCAFCVRNEAGAVMFVYPFHEVVRAREC